MFWCDRCKIWEHEKCLADAIRKDYLKLKPAAGTGKKPLKSLGKRIDITIAANEATGEVTAYIGEKGRKVKEESQDGIDQKVKTVDNMKNEDQDGVKTTIPVKCLKCGAQLK